ncbi:MAG: hypothetical protein PF572_05570 [Patescibacteria group bacterium]|nr:hypothetical protein [Patescibacteria group bacterium]
MKKYFTKLFILLIASFVLMSTPVFAQNLQDAFVAPQSDEPSTSPQYGGVLETVASGAGYDSTNTFDSMIGKIIMAALSLLGIIFLILLIYAGYLWMTAAGNEQQVTKAQSMITTAIIGLVIVLSAYSISFFVLSSLQEGALQETTTLNKITESIS